jgi:hypothetical protein
MCSAEWRHSSMQRTNLERVEAITKAISNLNVLRNMSPELDNLLAQFQEQFLGP